MSILKPKLVTVALAVQNQELLDENPFVTAYSRFQDRTWYNPEAMENLACPDLYMDFDGLMKPCSKWRAIQYRNLETSIKQCLYYIYTTKSLAWATSCAYYTAFRVLARWMSQNNIYHFYDISAENIDALFLDICKRSRDLTTKMRLTGLFKFLFEFGQAGLVCDYQPFDPYPGQSVTQVFGNRLSSIPELKTPPLSKNDATKLYKTSYEFLRDVGPQVINAAARKCLDDEVGHGELRAALDRFDPRIRTSGQAIRFLTWAAFVHLLTVTGARSGEILKLKKSCLRQQTIDGVVCFWVCGQPSKKSRNYAKNFEWQISPHAVLAVTTMLELASAVGAGSHGDRLFFTLDRKLVSSEYSPSRRATSPWALNGTRRIAQVACVLANTKGLTTRTLRVNVAEALSQEPCGVVLANRALGHKSFRTTCAYTNTPGNRHRVARAVELIAQL
jgi:integrase